MRLTLVLGLIALTACGPGEQQDDSTYALRAEQTHEARRAGDPLGIRFSVERTLDGRQIDVCDPPESEWCERDLRNAAPVLEGPDGELLPEAMLNADGDTVDWAVPEASPPGTYAVTGAFLVALDQVNSQSFEIQDWGAAQSFDPLDVEGRVFELADHRFRPLDVSDLLEFPPLYAQIDQVDGAEATFRILADLDGEACTVLNAVGSWDGSELTYSDPRLVVTHAELGDITAEDVSVSIAFRTGVLDEADGRLNMNLDSRPFDALMDDDGDICELLPSFGALCQSCGDGAEECVGVHAYQGEFVEITTPFGDDLPLCGVDAVDFPSVPSFACDFDGSGLDLDFGVGCSMVGRTFGPMGLFVVPWLFTRRRRQE
ncbi:MAG: hypothetical protein KC912_10230 [Proteobacteria bacterium]|nr:hypothetical protein [Pseudomonadota bacterium]